MPEGVLKAVSVSTQLATFPSSSIPRELNLVPARRLDKRERSVRVEGNPEKLELTGEDAAGTVIVMANPLIADVKIRDESRAVRSCSDNFDRKFTRG